MENNPQHPSTQKHQIQTITQMLKRPTNGSPCPLTYCVFNPWTFLTLDWDFDLIFIQYLNNITVIVLVITIFFKVEFLRGLNRSILMSLNGSWAFGVLYEIWFPKSIWSSLEKQAHEELCCTLHPFGTLLCSGIPMMIWQKNWFL